MTRGALCYLLTHVSTTRLKVLKTQDWVFFFLLCLLSVEPVGMSQTESNFKLKVGDASHETTDARNNSLFSVLLHLRPDPAPLSPPLPPWGTSELCPHTGESGSL